MSTPEIKEAILQLVRDKPYASFVDVQQLPGARGPYLVELADKNVVYWQGLSAEMAQALVELRTEGAIEYEPTVPLVYLVDGAVMKLPIAKRASSIGRGYKTPHWLPVTLVLGPKAPAA